MRTTAVQFLYLVNQGSDSYFYEISNQLDLGVKNFCLGSRAQQRKTYHNLTIAEPPIAVPLTPVVATVLGCGGSFGLRGEYKDTDCVWMLIICRN